MDTSDLTLLLIALGLLGNTIASFFNTLTIRRHMRNFHWR